jgi:hypothetical protein
MQATNMVAAIGEGGQQIGKYSRMQQGHIVAVPYVFFGLTDFGSLNMFQAYKKFSLYVCVRNLLEILTV